MRTPSGPGHERGVGVRRVDDVLDLDAELLGLLDVPVGRVDEHGEMVQQRPLGVRLPVPELEVRAGRARAAARRSATARPLEPVRAPRLRGRLGQRREERDVVEVVVDSVSPSTSPSRSALVEVEVDAAVLARRRPVLGQLAERGREVVDPERDVPERAALARPLGVEERQLAAARVGADERERVRALDDVHAEVLRHEVGDAVALGHPEGDVVEDLRLQDESVARAARSTERPRPRYFLRSTARCSCALFMRERPSMPIRLASL